MWDSKSQERKIKVEAIVWRKWHENYAKEKKLGQPIIRGRRVRTEGN